MTAKTQAKAAKALAEWTALKAKNKARMSKNRVKTSNWMEELESQADLVALSDFEDLTLRLSVERGYDDGAVALSRVLEAADVR